jgi:ABC-type glycerol-3-phosphate transport system substrate-binding protein
MMITRRTTVTAAAVAAAAALALSGCSASGAAASNQKVEISMLVNITPNLTETWWNNLVKPFEKANPNIHVKIQAPAAEGVAATLPQLLASGAVPDVVETVTPTKQLAPELVDLSSYKWANSGPLAKPYSIGGKNYMAGVGYQLQTTFFYNKKAFADAGITAPPVTLDEFDTDLGKLKSAGWTPIQTGGEWFTGITFEYAGIPSVIPANPDWHAKMTSGALTFSQTYGDIAQRYDSWVKKGYIPADAVGVKYTDAQAAFLAGKTAIYPMGSWFAAAEKTATSKPDIGVFTGPVANTGDKPAVAANVADPYIVMKASKHQDAALKLVEFLTTDKAAVSSQLEVDGNFRNGYDYPMDDLGKSLQKIVADTPASSFTPTSDGYGDKTVPAGYDTELNTQVQGLITGNSVQNFLKTMDDWFASNR